MNTLADLLRGRDPSQLSFEELYDLRNAPETRKDIPFQNEVGPFEHRAFNREQVAQAVSPWDAAQRVIGQSVLTAGYTPAKAISRVAGAIDPRLAFLKSRSEPSLSEMYQGFAGIGEGLSSLLRRR